MRTDLRAVLGKWGDGIPIWALERAVDIVYQATPNKDGTGADMLYALPSQIKLRLVSEIAQALAEVREK